MDGASLDLSDKQDLVYVYCATSNLASLDVSGCPKLNKLMASFNKLTAIDLKSSTALDYLDIYNNYIKEVDLSSNTNLTYLWVACNELTELDLSVNKKLTELSCWGNQITSLDLAGSTAIDKITMPIPAEQHQDTLGSSRGVQVPMFTVVKVPNGVTEQTVSARYQFPAATLRFAIRSDVHKLEKVLSVTMTAQDPIAGKMTFNRPSYSVRLIKGEKEVTVTVDKPAAIEKGGYLYMNVMRGVYEGVTIKVTTDQNTYLFENGRFDLTDPEASLFKVNLPLDVSVVKPKPSYYTEISEGEVFSADEKYLIAYKYSDTEYYVASEFVDYYLYYESFEVGENGLEATDRLTQYAFTFTPVEGTEYVTLYSDAVSNSSPSAMYGKGFVGSPATTYTDPGKFVRGSQEDVDSPDTHLRYCWKVTFEDGAPQINSVLVDGYRIAFERWGQLFTPCKLSNTDSYPIVILKLTK